MRLSTTLMSLVAVLLLLAAATGSLSAPAATQPFLASAAPAAGWTITDLGTLGGTFSIAYDMSDSGYVTGYSETAAGAYHAFRWEAREGMRDLATLPGGSFTYATAVNNRGQVVGTSWDSRPHAILWDERGGMRDLGTLPGFTGSQAFDINDTSQVVGTLSSATEGHAFLWDERGGMRDLGTLPGFPFSAARGINSAGQVVGSLYTAAGEEHAFLWTASGGMRDLGTLPGFSRSQAWALNDTGQVVGGGFSPTDEFHAFLWDERGGMRDLGTLAGFPRSRAWAINNTGRVVGIAFTMDSRWVSRAVLWDVGGIRDLTSLLPPQAGWDLWEALSINQRGQIVGQGVIDSQSSPHAFVLTPSSH